MPSKPSSRRASSRRASSSASPRKPASSNSTSNSKHTIQLSSDDEEGESDDDDDDEPEYEVEKILDHKFVAKTGTHKFLVKWLGYPDSENTWEPEANVMAPELIDAYWASKPRSTQVDKKADHLRNANHSKPSSSRSPSTTSSSSKTTSVAASKGKYFKLFPDLRGGGSTSSKYASSPLIQQRGGGATNSKGKRPADVDGDSIMVSGDEDEDDMMTAMEEEEEVEAIQSSSQEEIEWAKKEQEWKAEYDPMKSWEDVVKQVSTLERTDDGQLLAYLDFSNGATLIYPTSIANKKCPQKLLEFYEAHLKFKEPERDLSQVSKSGLSKRR
ncbi:unnamed protein product [Sympodiomycopsis kandeliae]